MKLYAVCYADTLEPIVDALGAGTVVRLVCSTDIRHAKDQLEQCLHNLRTYYPTPLKEIGDRGGLVVCELKPEAVK